MSKQNVELLLTNGSLNLTTLLLVAAVFLPSPAFAARETFGASRSNVSNLVGAGQGKFCKDNVCLPQASFDDDPTIGGKFSECGILSSVLSSNKSSGASSSNSESELCSHSGKGPYKNQEEFETSRISKLNLCLDQVRKALPNDLAAQKKYIGKLPSPRLKTFLAMAYTAYGEAGANMKAQDHTGIQKVVANRTNSCVNGPQKDVTAWEIATDPLQFSMYNKNIYGKNGDKFIKNKEKSPERMKLALKSFLRLQCATFEPPEKWASATHYHADYVKPAWGKKMQQISPAKIDGTALHTSSPMHKFYAKPWNCALKNKNAAKMYAVDHPAVRSDLNAFLARVIKLSLMAQTAWAQENDQWEIADYPGHGTFLRMKSRPLVKTLIQTDIEGAQITMVRDLPGSPDIEMIEYDAGEHGTKQLFRLHNAVLFNRKTQKIIADLPLRYAYKGGLPLADPEQPRWTVEDSRITVYEPESGETTLVEF